MCDHFPVNTLTVTLYIRQVLDMSVLRACPACRLLMQVIGMRYFVGTTLLLVMVIRLSVKALNGKRERFDRLLHK